jgi:metallo-beta-lactamase class B
LQTQGQLDLPIRQCKESAMFDHHISLKTAGLGIALAHSLLWSGSAPAEPIAGCPSETILSQFEDFGRSGKMPPELGRWLSDPKAQYIEPYKAFDNAYFVGVCWVSAWIVSTKEGTVLIDTLHEPHVDQLIANIKKVGVDLADIKYVLMTHGHFDHVGGAYKLKPLLANAKFVMTQTGWDEAQESARQSEATPRAWKMIAPDIVAKDGDVIRLGDAAFAVYETPGHTYGTASYAYDVRDGARSYRAVTVGRPGIERHQGFRAGRGLHRQRQSAGEPRQAIDPTDHRTPDHASVFDRADGNQGQACRARARRAASIGRSGRPDPATRPSPQGRGRAAGGREEGRPLRLAEISSPDERSDIRRIFRATGQTCPGYRSAHPGYGSLNLLYASLVAMMTCSAQPLVRCGSQRVS